MEVKTWDEQNGPLLARRTHEGCAGRRRRGDLGEARFDGFSTCCQEEAERGQQRRHVWLRGGAASCINAVWALYCTQWRSCHRLLVASATSIFFAVHDSSGQWATIQSDLATWPSGSLAQKTGWNHNATKHFRNQGDMAKAHDFGHVASQL